MPAVEQTSILQTIKKLVGVDVDDTSFDTDILIQINGAFGTLTQLGVGPVGGFAILGGDEQWPAYSTSVTIVNMVKTYLLYKTKLGFDPPATSFAINAIESQIKELEFRLLVQAKEVTTV